MAPYMTSMIAFHLQGNCTVYEYFWNWRGEDGGQVHQDQIVWDQIISIWSVFFACLLTMPFFPSLKHAHHQIFQIEPKAVGIMSRPRLTYKVTSQNRWQCKCINMSKHDDNLIVKRNNFYEVKMTITNARIKIAMT